ncbi:hypothetical protein L484_012039 [Morus notabilis]|uniref:BHLH domain-containing protein n=1 Tax=Morus notabilis TaxID=981085 RepID=W9R2D3_9ROSA|nr:transcription factor bHLH140 [Morus notabilis]EXB52394.1 hypothetical protein L484_012039 [Morus notabilis]
MNYFPSSTTTTTTQYSTSSSSRSCAASNNNKKEINKVKKGNSGNNNIKRSGNKGVMKLSTDPQSVAARERRHRISDRFKILQSLVPGGAKMDTVSMLEEAIQYVKFLKTQIWLHQTMINYQFVDDQENYSQDHTPNAMFLTPPDHQCNVHDSSNGNVAVLDDQAPLEMLMVPDYNCAFGQGHETTSFEHAYGRYD